MRNLATVPQKITDEIIKFCQSINLNTSPIYINSTPIKGNLRGECFENVQQSIQEGELNAYGWIIWQTAHHLLQAEFHSVIKQKDGSFVCVTPYNKKYTKILFLPDNTMLYDERRVRTIYKALVDLEEVRLFIEAVTTLNNLEVHMTNPQVIEQLKKPEHQEDVKQLQTTMQQIESAIEAYEKIVLNGVKRNDFCICGSGRKFKNCCI